MSHKMSDVPFHQVWAAAYKPLFPLEVHKDAATPHTSHESPRPCATLVTRSLGGASDGFGEYKPG